MFTAFDVKVRFCKFENIPMLYASFYYCFVCCCHLLFISLIRKVKVCVFNDGKLFNPAIDLL